MVDTKKIADGHYPSAWVSAAFQSPGFSISIGICMILYMTAFFGVQFWMRFKKLHNKEFVECHKKAWIMLLNIGSIYLYNRVSVATTIILWFALIAHIGALVLCVLEGPRIRMFKHVMSAALALSALNHIIHFFTRAATSGNTSMSKLGSTNQQLLFT